MAFQVGTAVNPALGNADFSGFARAAEIQGAAIANIGAQIGGAIKEHKEKKEEKLLTQQAAEFLAGLPGAENFGVNDVESAKVAIKSMGGVKPAMSAVASFMGSQANIAATQAGIEATEAGTAQTLQATEQSAAMFPFTQMAQDLANQQAQQQLDFNEAMNPFKLSLAQLNVIGERDEQDRATKLFPGQLDLQDAKTRAAEQGILKSIADIDAKKTELGIKQDTLDLQVANQNAEQAKIEIQQRMLNSVLGGNMSQLEYIQAGGDMNELAKAEELTQGQSFSANKKMIDEIEEKFKYLEYNYENNTWKDTRGRNREGLPWQEFPELMNFLGTRESRVLADEGFTLGRTY